MSKSLFDSVKIGSATLKNRFVRSATWEGMCDKEGNVTSQLIDCYRTLVQGGVGLIISGYSYVREDGKQLARKMAICSDSQLSGLKELTRAVHDEGGVIFCQLVHAGGQTTRKTTGTQPLVPSVVDFAGYQDTPREMTTDEIRGIVTAFAEAAARAKEADFDGIQLHGAHGYLINQFLSPLLNQRQDEYGGSLKNRMRFLEDVYAEVRSAVGSDFPVTIKLTAADNFEGGLQPAEGVLIAKRLDELGIDAIEVSSGTVASGDMTPVRTTIDSPEKEAYNAELARAIKAAVNTPVIVVGGLRSGSILQKLLNNNDADMFSLSRPLIMEPDLPQKWQKDSSYIATCISCNGCFNPAMRGRGIACTVK